MHDVSKATRVRRTLDTKPLGQVSAHSPSSSSCAAPFIHSDVARRARIRSRRAQHTWSPSPLALRRVPLHPRRPQPRLGLGASFLLGAEEGHGDAIDRQSTWTTAVKQRSSAVSSGFGDLRGREIAAESSRRENGSRTWAPPGLPARVRRRKTIGLSPHAAELLLHAQPVILPARALATRVGAARCAGAAATMLEGATNHQPGLSRLLPPTHGRHLHRYEVNIETPVVPWKCGALADLGVTWSIGRDGWRCLELPATERASSSS